MAIKYKKQYIDYLKQSGIGANAKKPGKSIDTYVSHLNSVSTHLGINVSPETVKNENDILNIASKLKLKKEIASKTITDCKTALRRYIEMLEPKSNGFLDGEKLYQIRARNVLPILVRQAKATKKIYYSDLAEEIDIANPRNLNYPLGSIGNALKSLSKKWGIKIPQIQCIVVNKGSELPGEGIGWFIDKKDFKKLSKKQKNEVVNRVLSEVFAFNKWDDVLSAFGLTPLKTSISVKKVIRNSIAFGSGGESKHHKKLKNHIASNPSLIGLKDNSYSGSCQ